MGRALRNLKPMAFELFEEVRIEPRRDAEDDVTALRGRIGVVLGVSQEPGHPPAGYAVSVDGLDETWCFDPDDLASTGNMRSRSDFYDGTSIRVGRDGELRL